MISLNSDRGILGEKVYSARALSSDRKVVHEQLNSGRRLNSPTNKKPIDRLEHIIKRN
jgi:hypothetical protein